MHIREIVPGEEPIVWKLCQRSFAGFPWFENMSDEIIQKRWAKHSVRKNFCCLIAELDTQIAGVSWFHEISAEEIGLEKSGDLQKFVIKQFPGVPIVWVDATVTDPSFQKKGLATGLKTEVLKKISSLHSKVLILTRMRDDNAGIIRVNEKFGFLRTGIKVSTVTASIQHEFWYLSIIHTDS
jgi:GNAT superfamily N-acetyltransferase